jgi:hypothetical protein
MVNWGWRCARRISNCNRRWGVKGLPVKGKREGEIYGAGLGMAIERRQGLPYRRLRSDKKLRPSAAPNYFHDASPTGVEQTSQSKS